MTNPYERTEGREKREHARTAAERSAAEAFIRALCSTPDEPEAAERALREARRLAQPLSPAARKLRRLEADPAASPVKRAERIQRRRCSLSRPSTLCLSSGSPEAREACAEEEAQAPEADEPAHLVITSARRTWKGRWDLEWEERSGAASAPEGSDTPDGGGEGRLLGRAGASLVVSKTPRGFLINDFSCSKRRPAE